MKLTKQQIQERIDYEIIVDCYDEDEANYGWEIFMLENINYPFEAEYQVKFANGKREWQTVKVVGEAIKGDYQGGDWYVEIEVNGMLTMANLNSLRKIQADEETDETLQIWNYYRKH